MIVAGYTGGSKNPVGNRLKIQITELDFSKWIFQKSSTGKSLSEALIFASTNPQYDGRLFIEFRVHQACTFNTRKLQAQNKLRTCCVQKLIQITETISEHNMFSPGLSLEFSCIELVVQ